MKHLTFAFLLSITSTAILGQKITGQIEIAPYIRLDWYPKFFYTISPINTLSVNIRGTSWGVNANYKLPVRKKLYLKVGLGYYKYSFAKINSYNELFGKGNAPVINFPSLLYIVFTTDKYWYNCFSMNMGIEKIFHINKNIIIVAGININNFYTNSQYYHITADYPTGPPNNKYTLKNNRYFGFSANIQSALLKKVGRIAVGPSVILPVFDLWKQDEAFPGETDSGLRSKGLNGICFGILFNYSLTKNK